MSDCSPAASHEEALERFVTNGSSQSLSSLRKELAVSGEQSLLADILKQPKDSVSFTQCGESVAFVIVSPIICFRSLDPCSDLVSDGIPDSQNKKSYSGAF